MCILQTMNKSVENSVCVLTLHVVSLPHGNVKKTWMVVLLSSRVFFYRKNSISKYYIAVGFGLNKNNAFYDHQTVAWLERDYDTVIFLTRHVDLDVLCNIIYFDSGASSQTFWRQIDAFWNETVDQMEMEQTLYGTEMDFDGIKRFQNCLAQFSQAEKELRRKIAQWFLIVGHVGMSHNLEPFRSNHVQISHISALAPIVQLLKFVLMKGIGGGIQIPTWLGPITLSVSIFRTCSFEIRSMSFRYRVGAFLSSLWWFLSSSFSLSHKRW